MSFDLLDELFMLKSFQINNQTFIEISMVSVSKQNSKKTSLLKKVFKY